MQRLFVAVEIPADAIAQLVAIQPLPKPGMRAAEASQMHLTLHFIGQAETAQVAAALASVVAMQFPLTIQGVGHFSSPRGAVTLWAGVAENPQLLELHAATAVALSGLGFQPERRPYHPHITLARWRKGVDRGVVEELVTQYASLSREIDVTRFGLYSSANVNGAPVYSRECSYLLE